MHKKGFTLVELLAVIVILAIILVIAVPNIMKIIEKAKKESLSKDAAIIAKHLEANRISGSIDIETFTKEDLDSIGVKSDKYDGFAVTLIKDKIVVTLTKDGYIGENKIGSKVYGVQFDGTNSAGVRTDDAIGLNYQLNTSTITSDFDNEEIYSEMEEVTDSYGNVFIKVPRFWIKKTVEGNAYKYQISRTQQDIDYYLPSCFYDEASNKILPYVLVGKYNASLSTDGTKLESKSGKAPLVSKSINQFRTYARNNNVGNNQGYQLLDIHAVDMLQALFYVEFATLDSQSIMKGFTSGSEAKSSGETDGVSTPSGSPTSNTDGKHAMKYRGIENLYGNIWQWVDGINIKENQSYVARDALEYQSDKFDGAYTKLGYKNATANGWVKEMGNDKNNPFIQLPVTIDASYTNSPYKDYYYQNKGDRVALFGGYWSYGSNAGISHWYLSFSSSSTNIYFGGRLLKTPL